MTKNILITGATSGIGLETAKMLAAEGHNLLLHGRSSSKLKDTHDAISSVTTSAAIYCYECDLADLKQVKGLAQNIINDHQRIDIIINNAGIYRTSVPITKDGLDVRFVVNTIAPFILAQELLPNIPSHGRIINVSSAAQSPVNIEALLGRVKLSEGTAYAQSKLAITMWSRHMALSLQDGPTIVAVNPGSLLGSKMVNEAFGIQGGDIRIGAKILCRIALDDEFASSSGKYFDNDSGKFASPHPDALDTQKSQRVIEAIHSILNH